MEPRSNVESLVGDGPRWVGTFIKRPLGGIKQERSLRKLRPVFALIEVESDEWPVFNV